MATRDLLDIAADAAERIEREGGLVACGRRINGITRVDFWTRGGRQHSLVLEESMTNIDDIVRTCLATAALPMSGPANVTRH